MPDAKIIQMFKSDPTPEEAGEFEVESIIDADLDESLNTAAGYIGDLWEAQSRAEFADLMGRIRAEVARWPDG